MTDNSVAGGNHHEYIHGSSEEMVITTVWGGVLALHPYVHNQ